MQLTEEQTKIINSSGNIKINAVAGSGKTTSIIEYAKTKPGKRILYLAFNKTVKEEAKKKFTDCGLTNVRIETAHSLAFKPIVRNSNYKICHGYNSHQVKEILKISPVGEKLSDYILANHVYKFVNFFCNSSAAKVKDLNYLDTVTEPKAQQFVKKHYKKILHNTRLFLAKMDKAEIEIIHDFYLKKYQLSNPGLPYHYILFDEGQDASPTMLDIFLKQKATKVIVGDAHQQIYGWRYAINSLNKVDFSNYFLTNSFRFNSCIGRLAQEILKWKKYFIDYKPLKIKGTGKNKTIKTCATLARTNTSLLIKAIEILIENPQIKTLYFEGHINSYTFSSDGNSIFDVLNLYSGNKRHIKDKVVKKMRDFEELEEYADKIEDPQLKMIISIVKKYENNLPFLIRELKECHVNKQDKEKADMIFSTVHRSKGMEYDEVTLLDDFITEEDIISQIKENDGVANPDMLAEEINLVYVALTRTKSLLNIPGRLVPKSMKKECRQNAQVNIINDFDEDDLEEEPFAGTDKLEDYVDPDFSSDDYYWEDTTQLLDKFENKSTKSKSDKSLSKKFKKANTRWTEDEDDLLTEMYCKGCEMENIVDKIQRSPGAIQSRMKKLELFEKYG